MAINPPSTYGRDIACMDDADALFSSVTGVAVVAQAAYHRLTNDSVLGSIDGEEPNEETDNWGYNVSRLAGMPVSTLAAQPPLISAALQKDPRIATADVTIQLAKISARGQMFSLMLTVQCLTALGPFALILGISDTTVAIIGGSSK